MQEIAPVTEFSPAFFRASIYWNLLFQLTYGIDKMEDRKNTKIGKHGEKIKQVKAQRKK